MGKDHNRLLFYLFGVLLQSLYLRLMKNSPAAYLLGINSSSKHAEMDVITVLAYIIPLIFLLLSFMDELPFYLFNYGRFMMVRSSTFTKIILKMEKRIIPSIILVTLIQYLINHTFTIITFQLYLSFLALNIMAVQLMLVMSMFMMEQVPVIIISTIALMSHFAAYYSRFPCLNSIGKFIVGGHYLTMYSLSHYLLIDLLLPLFISLLCMLAMIAISRRRDYF